MTINKKYSLWLGAILAVATAGVLCWVFLFSGTSRATGSDPCTAHENHYDVRTVVRIDGETIATGFSEVSPNGLKLQISEVPGGVVAERIQIADRVLRNEGRAVVGASFEALRASGTIYERRREDGAWSAWTSERVAETPTVSGVGEGICGHDLSDFPSLTRGGTETIDGVSTTKYSTSVSREGDPDVTQLKVEIWVDDDGQLRRRTISYPPARQENEYTFVNQGQTNNVSAPTTATPAPAPTATETPTPTLTPTSTSQPAATRTATPTPAPAATPTPASLAAPDAPRVVRSFPERGGSLRVQLDWNDVAGASRYRLQVREGTARWRTHRFDRSEATLFNLSGRADLHFRVRASGGGQNIPVVIDDNAEKVTGI